MAKPQISSNIPQFSSLMGAIVDHKLPKDLQRSHARLVGVVSDRAQRYFDADRLRPDETGHRPNARQTQKFTFGYRGSSAAFVGEVIHDPQNDIYGFGFPVISRADARTDGVWRVIEFGIGARGTSLPAGVPPLASTLKARYGPRGTPKFPARFTFLPFQGRGGVFLPRSGAKAQPVGLLVTPQGRPISRVRHPGQQGKFFLTKAWAETIELGLKEYQTIMSRIFRRG